MYNAGRRRRSKSYHSHIELGGSPIMGDPYKRQKRLQVQNFTNISLKACKIAPTYLLNRK